MIPTGVLKKMCLCIVLIAGSVLPAFSPAVASMTDTTVSVDNSENVSLNLDQLIGRALQANRHLLQSALLVESSQYSLQGAESAFDLKVQPVANFGLSKSESTTEQATGLAGKISRKNSLGITVALSPSLAYIKNDGTSSGVGVSLSVPLLRGFGRDYTYDAVYAADYSLATNTRNVYLAEVETVLETVTLTYEILRQQELVNLYRQQEKRLEGHAAIAGIMEATELGTPIDTYRARIRLKDVQDQLTVAQEKQQATLDRLKVLLAFPLQTGLQIEASLSYQPTTIRIEQAAEIAFENRLELEQSAADLAEAVRKSRVAERGLLPDLNLVATYRKNTFLEGLDSSELYYGDYWSVGLTSSTDLARSEEKFAFQRSRLDVRRMKLQQQTRHDIILAEVKQQLTALEKEEQRIQLRRQQIVQASGKMRLAEIKFSHGMGGNFDLIESETELQRAKVNLLSEKTFYIVGQYRLRAALGTLVKR